MVRLQLHKIGFMAHQQHSTQSATLKAQPTIAVPSGDKTMSEIAKKYEVHVNQYAACKIQLEERSS